MFLYIINLDEEILMRVFFASVNVVYPRNDLLGNISIDQLRYINFEKGYESKILLQTRNVLVENKVKNKTEEIMLLI